MKQVMDRVQIFRSVQAMHHHGTAGVRVSRQPPGQEKFRGKLEKPAAVALSGLGAEAGGMAPLPNLRTTFSKASPLCVTSLRLTFSSDSPAVRSLSL